jgi:hypothetical protein
MGQHAEAEWYKKRVTQWVAQYGAVPPPWVFAENSHPYSIRWRMGEGETLLMVFGEWWEQENKSETERIEYFQKWPAPPRWMPWMADVIWGLESEDYEGEFDYQPYFRKLTDLGFQGADDYESDLDDEKWIEMES